MLPISGGPSPTTLLPLYPIPLPHVQLARTRAATELVQGLRREGYAKQMEKQKVEKRVGGSDCAPVRQDEALDHSGK